MKRRPWLNLIRWLIVLAIPITLLAANLNIVTRRWFVHWEYNKTGFPSDLFGLSVGERTHLAEVCVDYLATNAPIALLQDLRLPDGTPAFNARELRHMVDVQAAYQMLLSAGIVGAIVLCSGIGVLSIKGPPYRRISGALVNGALLTFGLLGIVGLYMVLGWQSFFTFFHRIFFQGETWLFPYSDTLIRLFPMRFWVDVAIVVVGLLAVEAGVVGGLGIIWAKREGWERQTNEKTAHPAHTSDAR
jgi:integral membrane protein (TIGR01906 family)